MLRFHEIQNAICVTLYYTLRNSIGQEYFSADEIRKLAKLDVGAPFVKRACDALNQADILTRSSYDDSEYYSLHFRGFDRAEELIGQGFDELGRSPDHQNLEAIPAADRIVLRSDNEAAFNEVEREVGELRKIIRSDNEVGQELGDDRQVIDHELEVAENEIKRGKFRLSSLIGWLKPVLSFLGKRFAGTSIDELTAKLISALEKLI